MRSILKRKRDSGTASLTLSVTNVSVHAEDQGTNVESEGGGAELDDNEDAKSRSVANDDLPIKKRVRFTDDCKADPNHPNTYSRIDYCEMDDDTDDSDATDSVDSSNSSPFDDGRFSGYHHNIVGEGGDSNSDTICDYGGSRGEVETTRKWEKNQDVFNEEKRQKENKEEKLGEINNSKMSLPQEKLRLNDNNSNDENVTQRKIEVQKDRHMDEIEEEGNEWLETKTMDELENGRSISDKRNTVMKQRGSIECLDMRCESFYDLPTPNSSDSTTSPEIIPSPSTGSLSSEVDKMPLNTFNNIYRHLTGLLSTKFRSIGCPTLETIHEEEESDDDGDDGNEADDHTFGKKVTMLIIVTIYIEKW